MSVPVLMSVGVCLVFEALPGCDAIAGIRRRCAWVHSSNIMRPGMTNQLVAMIHTIPHAT